MAGLAAFSDSASGSFVLTNGRVVLPDGVIEGSVSVVNGQIARVGGMTGGAAWPEEPTVPMVDLGGRYLAPGFIDMHVHGGGGADFMDLTPEAFETAIACHLRHGVTSIVPTNSVASHEQTLAFLELARAFHRRPPDALAGRGRVIGSHLYGPYFADEKIGMHPKLARPPTEGEYRAYLTHADHMLVATCAPELDGSAGFYRAAERAGVRLNAGHSNATWTEMQQAYDLGVRHIDHFFCAMSNYVSTRSRVGTPMQGGMMEFALASGDVTTELIADGKHLSADLMRFAIKMMGVDRVALVSDSSRAVDMPVGEYTFGPADVATRFRSDGEVGLTLDGKGLASGIRPLDFMVRHMANQVGLGIAAAVRMATLTPAKVVGVDKELGSIAVGKLGDFVVLDDELNVERVMVNGEWLAS